VIVGFLVLVNSFLVLVNSFLVVGLVEDGLEVFGLAEVGLAVVDLTELGLGVVRIVEVGLEVVVVATPQQVATCLAKTSNAGKKSWLTGKISEAGKIKPYVSVSASSKV
jgi:hypothetical protein